MKAKHIGVIVLILALGGAVVSLYSGFTRGSPSIDLDPYQIRGAVVAEETAKLLGNQGQVVVVASEMKSASLEAELKVFSQALKKIPGLSVLPPQRLKLTPMMMTSGAVPPDELARTLQSHPNLGAVVLYFAFPELADQDLEALKRSGAKFVVVSGYRPGYQRLLERQAIDIAILPRSAALPAMATQKPRTLRERFNQEYVILTHDAPTGLP